MTSLKRPFGSLDQTSTLDDDYNQYYQYSSLNFLHHGDSAQAEYITGDWDSVLGDVIGNPRLDTGANSDGDETSFNEHIFSSISNVYNEFQLGSFNDLGISDLGCPNDLVVQATTVAESPEPAFNVCYGMVSRVIFSTAHLDKGFLVEIGSAGQISDPTSRKHLQHTFCFAFKNNGLQDVANDNILRSTVARRSSRVTCLKFAVSSVKK